MTCGWLWGITLSTRVDFRGYGFEVVDGEGGEEKWNDIYSTQYLEV